MWIVDRIEGEFALCETEDREIKPVPLKALPAGVWKGTSCKRGRKAFGSTGRKPQKDGKKSPTG